MNVPFVTDISLKLHHHLGEKTTFLVNQMRAHALDSVLLM